MFEKSKGRYLTRGVDAEIPLALQIFMWNRIDELPEKRDYLQVFDLSATESGLQKIVHRQEQPAFEMTYIIPTDEPITSKVYVIDDGEYCTMLLAEEY